MKFEVHYNHFTKTWYIRNTYTTAMLHGFKTKGDAEETIKFFVGEQE